MSNAAQAIKLMGIGCVTVALVCAFIFVPDQPEIIVPLIVILAGLLGVPLAVKAAQRRVIIARGNKKELLKFDEGLKWTWWEIHAFVSGIGDMLAFNKAEKIPKLDETPEQPKDDDFYAIIAHEAWYYKMGTGVGRLIWGGIIIACVFEIIKLVS